jgi:hypothetical protein
LQKETVSLKDDFSFYSPEVMRKILTEIKNLRKVRKNKKKPEIDNLSNLLENKLFGKSQHQTNCKNHPVIRLTDDDSH